jgi:hypothetical protein
MHLFISQMLAADHIREMRARAAKVQLASDARGGRRRRPTRHRVLPDSGQTLWKPMPLRWRRQRGAEPG